MNIPGYRLLEKCGRGAYGDVWLAVDSVGRKAAVKILDSSVQVEKELAGLRCCARLKESRHLIRILHIGEADGALYYTMDPADPLETDPYKPATLGNLLLKKGRFPADEVLGLADDLLDGLAELHAANLIHRDIKPENILFVGGIVKLSDVGLVRSLSGTVSLGGTLGFIPPERISSSSFGSQTMSDDLYALGKVLYCAWTGNSPDRFPAVSREMSEESGAGKLNRIILKACDRNERNRFRSTEEFRHALAYGIPPEMPVGRKTNRLILFFLCAAVLLSVFCVFLLRSPENKEEVPPRADSGKPKNIIEFTASDGPDDSRVSMSFTERQPEPASVPSEFTERIAGGLFANPRKWNSKELVFVTRSPDSLMFGATANGFLELVQKLPAVYRICFTLESEHLENRILLKCASKAAGQGIGIEMKGNGGIPELNVLEYSANRWKRPKMYSSGRIRGGKNRVELIRMDTCYEFRLNGDLLYRHALLAPAPGGTLVFEADCGLQTDLTISEFGVYTAENVRIPR